MENYDFMWDFGELLLFGEDSLLFEEKNFSPMNTKNLLLFIKSKRKFLFYLEQNKIYKKIEIFICVK